MKIPRPDQSFIELFKSVPDDPHVMIRPMFGNIAAFVNGNMFFGLFGNDLFVRLSDKDPTASQLRRVTVSVQRQEHTCGSLEM